MDLTFYLQVNLRVLLEMITGKDVSTKIALTGQAVKGKRGQELDYHLFNWVWVYSSITTLRLVSRLIWFLLLIQQSSSVSAKCCAKLQRKKTFRIIHLSLSSMWHAMPTTMSEPNDGSDTFHGMEMIIIVTPEPEYQHNS